jgi:hypothetical protein
MICEFVVKKCLRQEAKSAFRVVFLQKVPTFTIIIVFLRCGMKAVSLCLITTKILIFS